MLTDILNIKVGDIITLKDFPALKEKISGLDFTVEAIEKLTLDHCQYRMFKFKEKTDRLVVKYLDSDTFDLRWYYVMDWVGEGTRADALDKNHYFLFQNPGKDDFIPKELKWSEEFSLRVHDKDVVYQKIKGSEQHGEISIKNEGSYFLSVVEFRSTEDTEDPYILILEVGGIEDDNVNGGWLIPLEGHSISENEIEVLTK